MAVEQTVDKRAHVLVAALLLQREDLDGRMRKRLVFLRNRPVKLDFMKRPVGLYATQREGGHGWALLS